MTAPDHPVAHLAVSPADDPERRFRRLPGALRRWTPSTLWRLIRLPLRRKRWTRHAAGILAPYRKSDRPDATGPAAALGDFSGRNGLSRAAVYELDRLRRVHPDLEVIDAADAIARRCPGTPCPGSAISTLYLLSAPDTYALLLPSIPPERIASARRIGLWVWETPALSAEWQLGFEIVHEIWTPSAFSARAIETEAASRGIDVRLRPHAVRVPGTVGAFDRSRAGIPETAFLGVAIMDLRSCPARKNPWAHVAAWQAAFGTDPDRVLLLKIRLSKRTRCVRDELLDMIAGAPNIRLVEREKSDGEIAALQAHADVYLSLHRAEGYGLNIRECLEFGTPVIATDWSANAEYGAAYPTYHAVPYRMVPYRDWTGHYPDGDFSWAEADLTAAARTLRALAP